MCWWTDLVHVLASSLINHLFSIALYITALASNGWGLVDCQGEVTSTCLTAMYGHGLFRHLPLRVHLFI